HAHTRDDAILVHVQRAAPLDHDLHRSPPCRPEEPHPMESEIRARSNSLGCPRLPRLTSPRAWWHQTSPTSPDDGGDFHTTRVGSERAHGLLRQPRHGSRAWYCPFMLASGSDPRHESRVALLVDQTTEAIPANPAVGAVPGPVDDER